MVMGSGTEPGGSVGTDAGNPSTDERRSVRLSELNR